MRLFTEIIIDSTYPSHDNNNTVAAIITGRDPVKYKYVDGIGVLLVYYRSSL